MKIDFEKIKELTGCNFKGEDKKEDLLFFIRSLLYGLKTHNKNYNKEQEYAIYDLYNIMECIEFD